MGAYIGDNKQFFILPFETKQLFLLRLRKLKFMKKSILFVLAFAVCSMSFGQSDYKKPGTLAFHFALNDFATASDVRANGLSATLNANKWYQTRRMSPGMGISYIKGLGQNVDLATTLTGSFLKYPVPNKPLSSDDALLLEGAVTANIKLLTDKYCLNPFITLGVGASKYKGYYSAFIPVGLGLQFKVVENTYILLNSQYRTPVTDFSNYHFYHSIGFAQSFPKKVEEPVAVVETPVILDKDGDGIPDADDKCPDVAGLASLQGCPDRDGDGIADMDDKCPDQAGTGKYQGCPIPDTDGDGINDEDDKCVTVKGVARYQGCPVPDTDGDGINDEEDKCVDRAGVAENAGCPVIAKEVIDRINFAAKNVFFSTGSYKLLPKSYKSLNEVVSILKTDETLLLDIAGHTDAQGADDKNQTLSENRAKAVKDYLVSKGIAESRLSSAGYGETTPVADNKTAAGRAKNRRTELTVRNY